MQFDEVLLCDGSKAYLMALYGSHSGQRSRVQPGWQHHATLFGLAGSSNMCAAAITNPVNVVKVRMQLDGALSSTQVITTTSSSPFYARCTPHLS